MTAVVDASALVELLIRNPAAQVVADRIVAGDAVAPELLDVETLSAVAGLARRGALSADAADAAAEAARTAPIRRVSHQRLMPTTWRLRHNVSLYDATYVALAMDLECTLITADARLARSVEGQLTVTLVATG